MNEYLQKFRAQYPDYGDLSDDDLAKALHAKFYADMPWSEFSTSIGMVDPKTAAELRLAQSGNPATDFAHMAVEGLGGFGDVLAGAGAAIVPGGRGYTEARDAFQQRTDDLQLLAPGASMAAAATPAAVGAGAVWGAKGLGAAMGAIRTARALPPQTSSLVNAAGQQMMMPGGQRSALEALRLLASPAMRGVGSAGRSVGRSVGKALPWAGGTAAGYEVARRFLSDR